MAKPLLIQRSYDAAMKRDFPREQLPQNSVWNLVDYIPSVLNARLRKRGGYAYASANINAVQASASYLYSGIVADYRDGQSILVFDEDGRVYQPYGAGGGTIENIGVANLTGQPVFYSDMVIVPDWNGAAAPVKITRSGGVHTIASIPSGPGGWAAIVYKDVIWIAGPASNPDRIFFSTAGNPESWDLTNKWLDVSFPIWGMAALSNAVLVFMLGRTARIRGSVPPPDSDFIVDDPQFEVGCHDPRSIALYRDKCIWANAQGLYITDGTALEDLTRVCGMKSWWRDVMAGREGFSTGTAFSTSTGAWGIAGAIYGDYYVYSVMNGALLVDSGFIDLTKYTWHRLSNIDATFFFRRSNPEELFFTRRGAARAGSLSGIFAPVAANKADANGTAVLPLLETGYFQGEPGVKTHQRLYLGYDLRDAATDNPVLTVSYIDSPEELAYTALAPTLAETLQYTRTHLPIDLPGPGIGFKVAQTNPSADTRLYDLEMDVIARESSR